MFKMYVFKSVVCYQIFNFYFTDKKWCNIFTALIVFTSCAFLMGKTWVVLKMGNHLH